MKSFLGELLTAVVAHTTVGFVHQLGHGDSEVVEKVRRLEQLLDRDTTLTGAIGNSASFMNNEVKSNKVLAQGLRHFFNSSELHAIARQLFAFRFNSESFSDVLPSIRLELKSLLSLYLGAQSGFDLERTTDEVFNALLKGCERGLQMAIDKGYLSAHEGASSVRHRVILDELSGIKNNLAFLVDGLGSTVSEVDEFEKSFRREVGQTHKFIKPPHFDASKRIPIDKLYVSSDFIRRSMSRKHDPQGDPITVPLSDFLEGFHRAVILGSPGGGKSTLVSKLAHDLSLRRARVTGRDMTPMVVTLRQYGITKQEHSHSILDFIETVANSDYQVKPPRNAVKYLLMNGRAVVLFDGLDELLDTSYRQRIALDIESFCRTFPSVPVLVTSREIGYVQAPLDETMFDVVRLASFNVVQVQDYVKKWFFVGGEFTAEHQRERVVSFLEESKKVSDLRSVPLLLALMCNIYRGEGYIPKNRPDVYAKCAEMLFERWDKSRGIPVALPFDAHLRPAMMYLAHWLYASEQVEQTVTEHQLVAKATEYLWPRRFEDKDQAESAAKGFVEFCRGRAWVFTDAGLTKDGETLYQFTHRTFLEYFTAAHLVRTTQGAAELMGILLPHVKRGEWEVVAQLTCQIEDRQREGAGDEILAMILTASDTPIISERWNLILFAMKCLEFIVPNPRVVRALVASLVQETVEYHKECEKRAGDTTGDIPPERGLPNSSWSAAFDVAVENRDCFEDALRQEIQKVIESDDPDIAYPGWEIVFFLGVPGFHVHYSSATTWLQRLVDDLVKQHEIRMKDACKVHFGMCRSLVGSGALTPWDMARLHGVKGLFTSHWLLAFHGGWAPVSEWIVDWVTGEYGSATGAIKKQAFADFDKLGVFLLDVPAPWVAKRLRDHEPFGNLSRKDRKCELKLQGHALFAAFALTAAILERSAIPPNAGLSLKGNELIDMFRTTYLARFMPQDLSAVERELRDSGLNEQEIQFALDWSSRKINLVDKKTAEPLADIPA